MSTEQKIIAAAEVRIRTAGYNGFSFRDIARNTGLTNAGVHHHFPTKAALAARVAAGYAARFVDTLRDTPTDRRVAHLAHMFSDSVKTDGRMCLCGLLAAESGALPEEVVAPTRQFFEDLADLLIPCFPDAAAPKAHAYRVLAQLEGAVLLSHILGGTEVFDLATLNLV